MIRRWTIRLPGEPVDYALCQRQIRRLHGLFGITAGFDLTTKLHVIILPTVPTRHADAAQYAVLRRLIFLTGRGATVTQLAEPPQEYPS